MQPNKPFKINYLKNYMNKNPKISIILPCSNEELSIGICIDKIKEIIKNNKLSAEIIIVDNGSTDKSLEIIRQKREKIKNLILVQESEKGYGSAYLAGFKRTKGKYLFMADSDNTYDFNEIPKFIHQLEKGYDFVIGDRFKRKMQKNTMAWTHKYIGNPILSGILRFFFKTKIYDAHCGMRAITKQALNKLNLQTTGMEFASEMVIKAIKRKLKIKQIPINYRKRMGKSKLNSLNDGWRHLRFMLLYSPNHLFLYPGLFFVVLGSLIMILLLFQKLTLFNITFQTHPIFIGSALTILGYQLILTGIFTRIYTHNHLNEEDPNLEKLYKFFNLEKSIFAGSIFLIIGFFIYLYILITWVSKNFGALNTTNISIFALTFIIIGIQTIFAGFFFSILGIKK